MKTIKEMRAALGLTQAAFGKKLNIPLRTIQDWELGLRKPPDYIVQLIAYRLEAELRDINISDKKL